MGKKFKRFLYEKQKLIENTKTLQERGSIDNLNLNSELKKLLDQLKAVNIFHSNIDHIANIIEKFLSM